MKWAVGGLVTPEATGCQQQQQRVQAGVSISVQGVEQRLEQGKSVVFLQALLERVLAEMVRSEQGSQVFPAFNGVYLTDCTQLVWPGLAQKAGMRLELQSGQLEVLMMDLNANDQTTTVVERPLPSGALHIADLGFFKLARFKAWSAQGVYWLTRYKVGTLLSQPDGTPIDLLALLRANHTALQLPVRVGAKGQLDAWLLAAPIDADGHTKRLLRFEAQARRDQIPTAQRLFDFAHWTLYLTNVPDLSFDQAFILARARWQIELLFKLSKSHALLLTSRSAHPIRQQVEGLAKFIAVIIAHWLLLVSGWQSDALGRLDALRLIRTYVNAFWRALAHPHLFSDLLRALAADMARLSPLSKRRKVPLAFQLWRAFDFAFP